MVASAERYYKSARHTIQRDPILYNDEISAMFGAKPSLWSNPSLAWRLMLGSCGAYQWRLQGPNNWEGAKRAVQKVSVTELMHYSGILITVLLAVLAYYVWSMLGSLF